MLLIAYTSTATREFQDGDLVALLLNSRASNKKLGLTGILLHSNGRFFQALEGPEDAVVAKYDVIALDPRHEHVRMLWRETEDERQFPRWTMGFKTLSDPMIAQVPGYDSFFVTGPKPKEGEVRSLLERFRDDDTLGNDGRA